MRKKRRLEEKHLNAKFVNSKGDEKYYIIFTVRLLYLDRYFFHSFNFLFVSDEIRIDFVDLKFKHNLRTYNIVTVTQLHYSHLSIFL